MSGMGEGGEVEGGGSEREVPKVIQCSEAGNVSQFGAPNICMSVREREWEGGRGGGREGERDKQTDRDRD